MRRAREPNLWPERLAALAVAGLLHALLGPLVAGWVVRPVPLPPPSERKPDEAAAGVEQSVEAQLLTEAEIERLLGPVPSAQLPPEAAPPPPEEPPVPATEPPVAPEDRAKGQFVTIPPPPREEVPDEARFQSSYNSKVEKEQVSELNAPPKPEMRRGNVPVVSAGDDEKGNTTDPKQATKEKQEEARTQASQDAPGSGDNQQDPSKEKGLPQPPQEEVTGKAEPVTPTAADPYGTQAADSTSEEPKKPRARIVEGGGGPLGGSTGPKDYRSLLPTIGPQDLARQDGSIDHFNEDMDRGHGTMLNTRANKHAWFFSRMKEGIWEHWNAVGAYRRHDPYGRVYGVRDRVTVLRIELKRDGSLQDVYVVENSGAAFLDDVAVRAVREAQPFPNPPGGLIDPDGIIRITFSFHLDIESGGFKLF